MAGRRGHNAQTGKQGFQKTGRKDAPSSGVTVPTRFGEDENAREPSYVTVKDIHERATVVGELTEYPVVDDSQNDYLFITHQYVYHEMEIPPRCRKPRPVEHTGTTTVMIPKLSSNDAPVAAIQRHDSQYSYTYLTEKPSTEEVGYLQEKGYKEVDGEWTLDKEYRVVDGEWYQKGSTTIKELGEPYHQTLSEERKPSAQVEEYFDEIYSRYAIIDGEVWYRTEEPHYYTQTFGLGDNHGGTSLFVGNPNGTVGGYDGFPLTHFEQAKADALRVAEGRGDTKDAEHIRNTKPYFDIVNPSAISPLSKQMQRDIMEKRAKARLAPQTSY